MGYKGIIFEGTGLGHVGKVMYDVVKKQMKKDVSWNDLAMH